MGEREVSRRSVLSGALAAVGGLALGGCGSAGKAEPTPEAPEAPPGGAALATWRLLGGYVDSAVIAIRPTRLAIYADGETIADAAYRFQLPNDDLRDLVKKLTEDLRAPHTVAPGGGSVAVVDTPTTVFTVHAGGQKLEASAVGLDELRGQERYSDSLYDVRDRLGAVHKQVITTAQPYLSDRVRVVAVEAGKIDEDTEIRDWPTGVPVPADAGPTGGVIADLGEQAARDAVRLLTRDLDGRGAWPTYRTAGGRLVRAAWRYLLPDE